MARTIGIGQQDFEKIRAKRYFYVDKTSFIKEWWDGGDEVTLINRPRRFGKTLNLSMVEKFFSVEYAGRGDLFENLLVWNEQEYRELQGTYPVLFLSFAKVKETSFLNARKRICQLITDLYNRHDFLLDGELLNENEKAAYRKISVDMEDYLAADSLNMLSNYLTRYYGKRVIILLDEYDTPMQEAYVGGSWDELVAFTRNLFNATFKTNPYLERALMTGITRVSRESMFSDLNNLTVVTTTSERYADSFGFTQEEVWEALEEYGLYGERENVRDWYDGFTFGSKRDIYNPWSIINYMKERKLAPYWTNTSSNSLAGKLIREGSADVKVTMEDLLAGGMLHARIDEQIVYNQLDGDEDAIWSLLLASGYLRVESCEFTEDGGGEYELRLTNKEVLIMFRKMITSWFRASTAAYNPFIKALLLGDVEAMNEYMGKIIFTTFSYFDTGDGSSEEPERFFHGFVLGLMVDLADRYEVTSNRESGFGRYDVMLKPRRAEDDAIIIEFKVCRKAKKQTLEEAVCEALGQIEEKAYAASLNEAGIAPERIKKYGFAFEGKNVLIG